VRLFRGRRRGLRGTSFERDSSGCTILILPVHLELGTSRILVLDGRFGCRRELDLINPVDRHDLTRLISLYLFILSQLLRLCRMINMIPLHPPSLPLLLLLPFFWTLNLTGTLVMSYQARRAGRYRAFRSILTEMRWGMGVRRVIISPMMMVDSG
jgi:hypothetical protein